MADTLRKPSELCFKCKKLYDGYNDMTPETARAIKRTGVSSVTDLIRSQTLAIRQTCTEQLHTTDNPKRSE